MRLFLVFGGIFSLAWFAQATQCYYPDGSVAGAHTPCTGGQESACCYNIDDSHHDLCFSNGLWVGTVQNGSTALAYCGEPNSNLCCGTGDDATTCCESGDAFQWDNATLLVDYYGTGFPTASLASTTVASPSSTAASSFLSTSLSTSTTVIPTAATSTSSEANQTTVGGGSTISDQGGCKDSTGLEIGLGIGLGFPLLLVSTALTLLFITRQRSTRPSHKDRLAVGNHHAPTPAPDLVMKKQPPISDPPHRAELPGLFRQEMDT
ncbi:hypothetical protein MMC25_005662 [Agyrium rufum]|nr:hypothetical protein [Agyrium rufum]